MGPDMWQAARVYWRLECHTPVSCTLLEATHLFNDFGSRCVAKTRVGGYEVSTMFIPIAIGEFALFETAVLRNQEELPAIHRGLEACYATWEAAERGHARVVEEVRKRLRISPPLNRRIRRAQALRQWERHEWLLDQQWNRYLSWIYRVWLVKTLEEVWARPKTFKDPDWDFVVTPTGFKAVPRSFAPSGASRRDWVVAFNGPPVKDVKNR